MKSWLNLIVVALLLSAGCETRSKARLEAQKAYLAGQNQAMMRNEQAKVPTVIIIGEVRNQSIPWTENLTLISALIAADYQGVGTPSEISIIRNGGTIAVDPRKMLRGEDLSLQPGDRVNIRP